MYWISRGLVGTRTIGIATFAWRPIDQCAALKPRRGFVRRSLCKNITADHFQAASQRTCAALSSRFLIPLLTMGGGLWWEPLRRPRGPRDRCGQLLRGPSCGTTNPASAQWPTPRRWLGVVVVILSGQRIRQASSRLSAPGSRANRRCVVFAC